MTIVSRTWLVISSPEKNEVAIQPRFVIGLGVAARSSIVRSLDAARSSCGALGRRVIANALTTPTATDSIGIHRITCTLWKASATR
jgi:hypothetical protein